MDTLLHLIDTALRAIRSSFLFVAVIVTAICLVDWLVRSRQISPFSAFARTFRKVFDPFMVPIERRVVNLGGLPQNAPWWLLAAIVIAGIILISALDFLRGQLGNVAFALDHGPRGMYRLLVSWVIAFLQLVLILRVVYSFLPITQFAWYSRPVYAISTPMLKPFRRFIKPFSAFDITPLLAWIALWIIGKILLSIW